MAGINIHQFTGIARRGDGIYDHVEELRKVFTSWGHNSNIYVLDRENPDYEGVDFYKNYRAKQGDLLIYHFGIGSKLTDFIIAQQGVKKFLIYHNMTPERYLLGIDNQSFLAVRRGRAELDRLRKHLTAASTVSDFNANDLITKSWYKDVTTIPILKDFSPYQNRTCPDETVAKWQSDRKTIFFIGRINPNKGQADLIRVLHAYTKLYGDNARLVIPGSWKNKEAYRDHLLSLANDYGLSDRVVMPGFIDDDDFTALFSTADVYLSMSEHEGFGVPFLEAFWYGVPVVALGSSAIPETLGGAGITLGDKDILLAATVVKELFTNDDLRDRMITAQKSRLNDFSYDHINARLKTWLGPYL